MNIEKRINLIRNTPGVSVWLRNICEHIGLGEHTGSPLHRVVQWFKTITTNEYIRGVKQGNWQPFNKKLWQRNYYEHIIRNEYELNKIREYIIGNPLKWDLDHENPDRIKKDRNFTDYVREKLK